MALRSILPVLLLLAAGCAKESLFDAKMPAPRGAGEPETVLTANDGAVPKGAVGRSYLDHVLREGPGFVLERVPVEEVVVGGKFVGWRVRELPADWAGGELRTGDVVTRVNAMPLETPNDFWAAWTTLGVATAVSIDYRRGEEARTLTVPVVGKPEAATARRPTPTEEPSNRPVRDKRFETVTIEGDPRSASPPVDWTTGN